MQLSLQQTTSLRLSTTAHLTQTMSLLEKTADELRQTIESKLASNPALELLDTPRCPQCRRTLPPVGACPVCSSPRGHSASEPIVFVSPRSDFASFGRQSSEDDLPAEDWSPAAEDLSSYVLRQIAPELVLADRPIAVHILTSLDEDGLLTVPLFEIARYFHVPIARVEKVLHLIQRAEPIGVGSPSPQAALLVQLEVLAEYQEVPPLAAKAISQGLELLSKRAYSELGRLLHVSSQEAERIANFISECLNPYPARAYWGDFRTASAVPPVYTNADIIITRLNDSENSPLLVEIVSPYAGCLRVNPLFRKALPDAPAEKAEQWHADYQEASLLIKCLQQRDRALVRLMQRLVTLQRDFILKGDAYLLPVTRAQLAEELQVHESTICRAVSDKAVQLPNRRIIPLSRLFDRSLHIRTALAELIAREEVPLSDAQLVELLAKQGFQVKRRTVAKYRAIEGILPARLRHHPSVQLIRTG